MSNRNILSVGILAALASPGFFHKADTGAEGGGSAAEAATGETVLNPFTASHPIVETLFIEIKKLDLNAGTQPRVAIDDEVVQEYTEIVRLAIKNEQPNPFDLLPDDKLPQVFRDPTGRCVPADGFHRIASHKGAHAKEMKVAIRAGTDRDAILFSCSANATHGVRRTNKDKRRAVQILLADPEWSQFVNGDIARLAFVGESLVRELRTVAKSPAVRKKLDTKTGKVSTIDTTAIGKGKGGGKKGAKAAAKKAGKKAADATPTLNESAVELDKNLLKIATAVGGTEGGKIRKAVLDGALELSARDVREWAGFAPKKIAAVAPLVTGGARMKPTKAFDFIASELGSKIVEELHNRALGGGGEYTYEANGLKIVATHTGKK